MEVKSHLIPVLQGSADIIPTSSPRVIKGGTTSFRDMLNGGSRQTTQQTAFIEDEDDEVSDDDEPPSNFEGNYQCLIILLSKEEKKRMHKPWKKHSHNQNV